MKSLETMQLPEYVCHKRVRAAKILEIEYSIGTALLLLQTPTERRVKVVAAQWMTEKRPAIGGYFVQYLHPETGAVDYESFSPALAFESGYVLAEAPIAEDESTGFREGWATDPAPAVEGINPVHDGVDIDAVHRRPENLATTDWK